MERIEQKGRSGKPAEKSKRKDLKRVKEKLKDKYIHLIMTRWKKKTGEKEGSFRLLYMVRASGREDLGEIREQISKNDRGEDQERDQNIKSF